MSPVLYIILLERNQATLWNRPLLLLSSSSILATTGRIPSPSGLTRDMAQCHKNHLYFLYSLPNIYCNIPQYSIDYFTLWHFSEYSVTKFSEGSVFQVVILPCGTIFFLLCVSSSALNLAIYFWWTVPPFSSRLGNLHRTQTLATCGEVEWYPSSLPVMYQGSTGRSMHEWAPIQIFFPRKE